LDRNRGKIVVALDEYKGFLARKVHVGADDGFEPLWLPGVLFDFQRDLTEWALRRGRAALFEDCGLGKTLQELVWAENVCRHTGGRVLILTPLAVAQQTAREGVKFGVGATVSRDGSVHRITVTNYEQLHKFKPGDFAGVVCDESSILKNFDGATRAAVTEFLRLRPYRLLATATAAPNDWIELGTSSEALGNLGRADVLSKFFRETKRAFVRRDQHAAGRYGIRPHAVRDFWRWVCSWARAIRKPSDLGYDDGAFALPEFRTREHVVKARTRMDGWLFDVPAVGLAEQRDERRRTIEERCEMAAALVADTGEPAVCWCALNDEGDLLAKLIPGAVQVSGADDDDRKVEAFEAFERGDVRVLVTKPTIAGFGLNWQHCAHQTFFPSHSFEQWYQAVRRSWRFGQTRPVTVDVVTSEGERDVLRNMQRKADAADLMFRELVAEMNNSLRVTAAPYGTTLEEVPSWL
jgi:hypothetical protein